MNRIDGALLLLRVVYGVSLAFHGMNKIRSGLQGTATWFESIGFRWPRMQALTAATSEIGAGLFLAVGLATEPAAAVMIALMIVAIVTVHGRVGYFIFLPGGGWEYCAAIATVGAFLTITGAGDISLDHMWSFPVGLGAWWTVVGLTAAVCHLSLCWRPSSQKTRA